MHFFPVNVLKSCSELSKTQAKSVPGRILAGQAHVQKHTQNPIQISRGQVRPGSVRDCKFRCVYTKMKCVLENVMYKLAWSCKQLSYSGFFIQGILGVGGVLRAQSIVVNHKGIANEMILGIHQLNTRLPETARITQ